MTESNLFLFLSRFTFANPVTTDRLLNNSKMESVDSSEEYNSSNDDSDDVTCIDDETKRRKDEILQRIEEIVKKLSNFREQYKDHSGISDDYYQAAALLIKLKETLNSLSENESIKRKLVTEEGKRVTSSGGICSLCDAVIFLYRKHNDFQEVSVHVGDATIPWAVVELLTSYLGYFSDRNPRYSRLFVLHSSLIEYSTQVIRQVLKKYPAKSDLVSYIYGFVTILYN